MITSPHRRLRNGVIALTAVTALLVGCSSDESESTATVSSEVSADSISIQLARAPIPAPGQTTTRVYGILVNDSLNAMRVISASSPAADSVDLLAPDDSVVLPAEGFVVEADGGLVMEPVNFKLQLNGIDPDALGLEIPVTLRFESGASFGFSAVLQVADE